MIKRIIEQQIKDCMFGGKAIILTGARQVGKTTLINQVLRDWLSETLILDGDDPITHNLLDRPNLEQLRQLIGKNRIVFIDEAQRIKDIGLTSKIIVDKLQPVQLVLSGSSSFDLMERVEEPLTGRKWTFLLNPVSWTEWQDNVGYYKAEQDLENRLIFGFYPDVLNHPQDQQIILKELASSYLYKDILMLTNIKKPEVLQKLVQALAWQTGNEVSYNELSSITGIDPKTVSNYIDILEKAYIVFKLPAFSRNHRDEIKTNRKIYFYDNGIRNAVIGQFQPFAIRQDTGALWENFLISERIKLIQYININIQSYFWRTRQQQEIDYVEENNGNIAGYEFKWNENRKVKFPKTFTEKYHAQTYLINRKNFRDFLTAGNL